MNQFNQNVKSRLEKANPDPQFKNGTHYSTR